MLQGEGDKQRFLSESIDFNYKMLVSACRFTTLYMLKKYNQRQYLFEDPLEQQYKVSINKQISCSCHEGNLGHCIHSLYVLTRIYKLPENHPLLFKKIYNEDDLKLMGELGRLPVVQGKKRVERIGGSTSEEFDRLREQMKGIQISQAIKQEKSQTKSKKQNGVQKEWPVFEPDTVCSICYDQIENQTAIIDCLACHNYFHTKCLTVWISQKQKQQAKQSCPMCRHPLEPTILTRITSMQQFYVKYHLSHGVACSSCGHDVLNKLYKCLLCEGLCLCEGCYMKWEHKNHDRFICRQGKKADWSVCSRSQFNINKLNANLEYMRKIGVKSTQVKVLMGDKYQKFIHDYIKQPSLLEHIINSLLDVEKQVHKTYKKLDFVEKDIVCCMCKKKKIIGMRRLSCRHFIDEKCLRFILENDVRQCPVDKKYILPGLDGVHVKLS